jgi:transposase-like protein
MAEALRDDLVERFEKQVPSAVRCFVEDFDACVAHLRCPPSHRRVVRTTNLLERLFGEERRRTKVAPTVTGERPVLKLMYASLIRASNSWRGSRTEEQGEEGSYSGDQDPLNPSENLQHRSDLTERGTADLV